mmetsp:Transcript_29164/g.53241  ORF Transcript_29164/g.53241 Transcript_29164/m.53241 type:complete len:211 (+) Transcript_29164:748-1380(+)
MSVVEVPQSTPHRASAVSGLTCVALEHVDTTSETAGCSDTALVWLAASTPTGLGSNGSGILALCSFESFMRKVPHMHSLCGAWKPPPTKAMFLLRKLVHSACKRAKASRSSLFSSCNEKVDASIQPASTGLCPSDQDDTIVMEPSIGVDCLGNFSGAVPGAFADNEPTGQLLLLPPAESAEPGMAKPALGRRARAPDCGADPGGVVTDHR